MKLTKKASVKLSDRTPITHLLSTVGLKYWFLWWCFAGYGSDVYRSFW